MLVTYDTRLCSKLATTVETYLFFSRGSFYIFARANARFTTCTFSSDSTEWLVWSLVQAPCVEEAPGVERSSRPGPGHLAGFLYSPVNWPARPRCVNLPHRPPLRGRRWRFSAFRFTGAVPRALCGSALGVACARAARRFHSTRRAFRRDSHSGPRAVPRPRHPSLGQFRTMEVSTIVVFGASGDLAKKKIYPVLW